MTVLSSVASIKFGTPDREAAAAATLKHSLSDMLTEEELTDLDAPLGFAIICIEPEQPLNVRKMAERLSDTIIRPVPVTDCTSETVEGDFVMFSAVTHYYDSSGQEAGHVVVEKVDCRTTSECIIDLDWFGGGDRYLIRRTGSVWNVVHQRIRWIV